MSWFFSRRNPATRLVLPPYSRSDVLQLVFLTVAVAGFMVLWFRSPVSPTAGPDPVYSKATAITSDNRDLDLKVEQHSHKSTIQKVVPPLPDGASASAAPLMDWDNEDVRTGTFMGWCFTGMDPDSAQVLRDTLNQLHTAFPQNVKWREQCPGAYTAGNTAGQDCGMETAVACAVYYGPHQGRVSINGDLVTNGQIHHQGKVVALAHEAQHIVLNLGHNNCGVVLDPFTNQPVPSVMTPVNLPDGPSCSLPAADGLAPTDWTYAYDYYRIAHPTPSPSPTPSPTPTPPPVPKVAAIVAERWAPGTAGCADAVVGDWCEQSVYLSGPTDPATCYRLDVSDGAGTYTALSDCVSVPSP